MNKLIIIIAILLSSCATPSEIIIPPGVVKPIILDARVYEFCDKLDRLPQIATFEEVLIIISNTLQSYKLCADKQKISVELLKQLSNKKEK